MRVITIHHDIIYFRCVLTSSEYIYYFPNLIFLVAAPPRVDFQHYRAIDILSKPFHKTNFCPSRQRGIRDSIEVSISACHAEDPGSIPGRGKFHVRGSLSKLKGQLPLHAVVIDSLAEWSKAPGLGPGPKGRGFKPHSCHTF